MVKHNWGMSHMEFCHSNFFNDVICTQGHCIHILNCRIQLAVNVQIPVEYGGLGGKAIYIGKCNNYPSFLFPEISISSLNMMLA